MKMFNLSLMFLACIFLLAPNVTIAKEEGEVFQAFIAATQEAAGMSTPIRCVIKTYTTDAQKQQYYNVLKSQGQMALFKEVKNNNLGFCQIGNQVSQQLMIAAQTPMEGGGRRINAVFMSIRGTFQSRAGSKADAFPFALVEMIMKPDGQGDGMLAPAVGITINSAGAIDLENIGVYPGKLMNLHEEKK